MSQKKCALVISILLAVTLVGCASDRKTAAEITEQDVDTARAAAMSGGSEFAVIEFQKGSYALTEQGRATLQQVASAAKSEGRDVEEIKVLAWADREYPADGAKAERRDVKLADNRASVIRTYLKNDLNTNVDVEKHNMAQRPGAFSELVKSEDYEIKNNFEVTGAAPVESTPDVLSQKISKAIIVIKYE